MIKLVSKEQMKEKINQTQVDFDRYNVEITSQISTKDVSIVVDFLNEEITGDCVAHGSWYDIDTIECIELLQDVFTIHQPIREIDFM